MRPWALGFLACLTASVSVPACTKLTEPASENAPAAETTPSAEAREPELALRDERPPQAAPAEPQPRRVDPENGGTSDLVTASHILVSYGGADRSRSERSKSEARKVAAELLARVRQGEDFGQLAFSHSDDRSAKANRGSLGTTPARSWVQPFAEAALALRPGEVSDLVETPFGFHIIKRHP